MGAHDGRPSALPRGAGEESGRQTPREKQDRRGTERAVCAATGSSDRDARQRGNGMILKR
ncbi:hypothetical protein GCM10010294_52590 [Streptomyces griseoloalbus]|nr:hypothetical protein GCM10010294_52590 [Streptomyces griseoloalbus]